MSSHWLLFCRLKETVMPLFVMYAIRLLTNMTLLHKLHTDMTIHSVAQYEGDSSGTVFFFFFFPSWIDSTVAPPVCVPLITNSSPGPSSCYVSAACGASLLHWNSGLGTAGRLGRGAFCRWLIFFFGRLRVHARLPHTSERSFGHFICDVHSGRITGGISLVVTF